MGDDRDAVTKTERIDRTLIWSVRIVGLVVLALVGLILLGVIVVFVATLIYGR